MLMQLNCAQRGAMPFKNTAAEACQAHRPLARTFSTPAASSCGAERCPPAAETPPTPPHQLRSAAIPHPSFIFAAAAAAATFAAAADPALALELHAEPANALSLPTWAVHTSSVIEWITGMALFWRYAEVSGNEYLKGMTWGMLPCLGSAMCACTWHFFYNTPELDFLVALQAGLTVVGNFTCWIAAYRIFEAAKAEEA